MGVEARLIIEVMGRPVENVKQALSEIIKRLGSEKGIKVKKDEQFSPKKIPETEDLYTTFAEIEIEADTIEQCLWVAFSYMPSNMEIISPESIKVTNEHLSSIANNIVAKLHSYDAIAKQMINERNILLSQAKYFKDMLAEMGVTDPFAKLREHKEKGKEANVKKNDKKKSKKKD